MDFDVRRMSTGSMIVEAGWLIRGPSQPPAALFALGMLMASDSIVIVSGHQPN